MTVRELLSRILTTIDDLDALAYVRIVRRDEENVVQGYRRIAIERLHFPNELVIDQRTITYAPELPT